MASQDAVANKKIIGAIQEERTEDEEGGSSRCPSHKDGPRKSRQEESMDARNLYRDAERDESDDDNHGILLIEDPALQTSVDQ